MSKGKGWHGDKKRHSQASKKGWNKRWKVSIKSLLASATGGKSGLSSIQTGQSPDYYRPTSKLIGVDKIDEFKKGLVKEGFEKTGRYDYTKISKRKGSPTGYELGVLNSKDRMFYDHIIVDRKGKIPDKQGILRLIDEGSGSDRGRRNLYVDLFQNAERVYAQDEKGNWRWYIHPNKSDIEHIDTKYSEYAKTINKLKGNKQFKGQKGIVLMARNPEEEKSMRKRIDNAFTKKEQKEMGIVFVSVEPTKTGVAGSYYPNSYPQQIKINPKYETNADVLIHELTHHHRSVGKGREGALKETRVYYGKDADLEESITEAEAITREKPFDKSAGYYSYLDKNPTERNRAQFEDRNILTGYETSTATKRFGELAKTKEDKIEISERNRAKLSKKNVRGKRAINRVEKYYPESNISKVKIQGKAEAIDTFHEYQNPKGKGKIKIQQYNPEAKRVKPPKIEGLRKKDLYEWKDGKKVKVR